MADSFPVAAASGSPFLISGVCSSSGALLSCCVSSRAFERVHLGSGVFVKQELSRPKDSLFCKEATKLLWGIPDLRNKSLTGAPCRRFVRQKEKQAPPRRAQTPRKLQAVAIVPVSSDESDQNSSYPVSPTAAR
ncbi:hypothetical protein HPB52_005797 [Rhipicephalus sanguineus]|uniref:Uncharacterized protein n=1 Tax=Rhipicephalus sanguineus TaxID=34632 RepID=A0A9D4SWG9_RHISA|nr:hypothetical protein HPB52_005797 [Rhipicephalus sanguineus]